MPRWRRLLARAARLLGPRRGRLMALFAVMLAAAFAEGLGFAMVMPLVAAILGVDQLSGELGRVLGSTVAWLPADARMEGVLAILVVLFLLRSLLLTVKTWLTENYAMRLRADWARQMFDHYLTARHGWLTGERQGVIAHNIGQETFRAAKAIALALEFVAKAVLAVVLFGLLAAADWRAALALTVLGLALFAGIRGITLNYSVRFSKQRMKLWHAIVGAATEAMANVRQIKLFGTERRTREAAGLLLDRHTAIETRFQVVSELPNNVVDLAAVLFVSAALLVLTRGFGVDLVQAFPTLAAFALILYRLFLLLGFIISRRMKVASVGASLVLVDDLLNDLPMREQREAGETLGPLADDIAVRGLTFSHDGDRRVFDGLDLDVLRGRTTALVGRSGLGKSTLADLLTGLYRPDAGSILINGHDIRHWSLASLRQRIGYVTQEAELFDGSIADNIRYGRPDAGEAELLAAARLAHVAEFAEALPEGYDTPIGERGARLSGGQRQRIAIARVVLRRPDVYIFDEATSALDQESERLIQDAIHRLAGEATVLVIAHRLSTIERADAIWRLNEDGRAEPVRWDALAPARAAEAG